MTQWIFHAPGVYKPGTLEGFQEITWIAPKEAIKNGKFPKFIDFARICAENSKIQFNSGIPTEQICGVSYEMKAQKIDGEMRDTIVFKYSFNWPSYLINSVLRNKFCLDYS